MKVIDLIRIAGDKTPAIHTGEEHYQDCLAWFYKQGFRWNDGTRLNDQEASINQYAEYRDEQCLVIYNGNKLLQGSYSYLKRSYHIFEYEELFPEVTISFDDLDSILEERM